MTDVPGRAAPAQAWVPDDRDFGSRLAAVRHRMRWNVKEAARECGVPAATWRLWEEGAMPRNLVTIAITIAGRTGADLDWLVYGPERAKLTAGRITTQYPVPRIEDLAPQIKTYPIGPLPPNQITFGDGRKGPRQLRRRPVALSA